MVAGNCYVKFGEQTFGADPKTGAKLVFIVFFKVTSWCATCCHMLSRVVTWCHAYHVTTCRIMHDTQRTPQLHDRAPRPSSSSIAVFLRLSSSFVRLLPSIVFFLRSASSFDRRLPSFVFSLRSSSSFDRLLPSIVFFLRLPSSLVRLLPSIPSSSRRRSSAHHHHPPRA